MRLILLPARLAVPVPLALLAVLAVGAVVVLILPSSTSVGVNYVVTTRQIPIYRKLIAFLDRDLEMRALADEITAGKTTDGAKAEALLEWVHINVRPVPSGQPIVDDHPWHVVVRGFGTFDQSADLFATLATYVGMPGALVFSRDAEGHLLYGFAVVWVDGAWRVFDPREGRAFRSESGSLATLEALREDPAITSTLADPREGLGLPYSVLLRQLDPLPERLRAYDQQLLPRIGREIERMFRR